MLMLSRRLNESIVIDKNIEIVITEIFGDRVKLGIKAPREIEIVRKELLDISLENKKAAVVSKLPAEFIKSFR